MSVDIPAPFDLLTSQDWLNATRIGTPENINNKAAGGVRITQTGVQWQESTEGEETGLIFDLNGTPSAEDWTGKLLLISHTFNAQNRIQIDSTVNAGMSIWLYSTVASVYEKFLVGGSDAKKGKSSNGHLAVVVDAEKAGHSSAGSFDVTNMVAYGVAVTVKFIEGTSSYWGFVSRAVKMGTTKTATDIPRLYGSGVKLKDLHTAVNGTSYSTVEHNYTSKLGNTYEYNCPFAIGKTGQSTTFDDEGVTVVSPPDDDPADPRFQLTVNSMRVYLDLQSGDTVAMSGTYVWGTRAPFDFDTAETVTLSNASYKGMGAIACGAGVTGNGNFDDTGLVTLNASGDLDGSLFKNPYGNHLLSIG